MDQTQFCRVTIPTYRFYEKSDEIVLYQIDFSFVSIADWRLEKRYSEFNDFDTILRATFQFMPSLPGKTLTTLKDHKDLEKRRQKLEKYLQELIKRIDIVTSPTFASFFELEQYAPTFIFEPPKLQYEIEGFEFTVRDFHFSNDENVLFVATAQTDPIQQMDAFISNKESTKTPLGSVELFQFNDQLMERKWKRHYGSMAICLHWDSLSQTLAVGFDKGSLAVFFLKENLNNHHLFTEVQPHTSRINGVFIDSRTNQIHTVSKDASYKIIALEGLGQRHTFNLGEELSSLEVCSQERQISIIGGCKGTIFIYDISKSEPYLLSRLNIVHKYNIKSLAIDTISGILFACCEEGYLQIVDIQKQGQERHSKLKTIIQSNKKSRQIAYCRKNKHIYVGDSTGQMRFHNALNGSPIYQFPVHDSYITRMKYYEQQGIIFTVAKKSNIKMWSLPQNWPNLNELRESAAQEIKFENIAMMKQQQQQQQFNQNSDSDEDDGLNNWHKK